MKQKPKLLNLDKHGRWYVNGAKLDRDHQTVMDAAVLLYPLSDDPVVASHFAWLFIERMLGIEFLVLPSAALDDLRNVCLRARREWQWVPQKGLKR